MATYSFAVTITRKFSIVLTLSLSSLLLFACDVTLFNRRKPSLMPNARPLIAFLREGRLWIMTNTGEGIRELATAPAGEAINEFVWSSDGSVIYFTVGVQVFSISLANGKVSEAGTINLPIGAMIDRLEPSRDPQTIIAHTLDADAMPQLFAFTLDHRATRELAIDDYNAISRPQSLVVRQFSDLSVSPDAMHVLFKEAVGANEQLCISDLETGTRKKITAIEEIPNFEESAELDGGRKILEASWSPHGRWALFIPAQSCSETGFCYGHLFLVDPWSNHQKQLSEVMMVGITVEWSNTNEQLIFENGGQIMIANTSGQTQRLTEGNHPKWQPVTRPNP